MKSSYTCNRGSSNEGNRKKKIVIPFDQSNGVINTEHPERRYLIESNKAWGLKVNNVMIWIPKSQAELFTYNITGIEKDVGLYGNFEFWLPMWLVVEKSLEIFIDTSYEPGLFNESVEDNMNS